MPGDSSKIGNLCCFVPVIHRLDFESYLIYSIGLIVNCQRLWLKYYQFNRQFISTYFSRQRRIQWGTGKN